MTSPTLQFVPQWLKKPSSAIHSGAGSNSSAFGGGGGPFTNGASSDLHDNASATYSNGATPGFANALASAHSSSDQHPKHPANGLIDSYSSISSPNYGSSSDTYPLKQQDPNRPFRYTKQQMLALFDQDAVKARPLELLDLVQRGDGSDGVILNDKVGVPMGLIEWTEEEKKLFSNPVRRQLTHTNSSTADSPLPTRSSRGLPSSGLASPGLSSLSSGGRGFGRGEGGAFGGGSISSLGGLGAAIKSRDGNAPRDDGIMSGSPSMEGRARSGWTAGAGLGGQAGEGEMGGKTAFGAIGGVVGGRGARESPRVGNAASTWRPNLRSTGSASGAAFEGVLGFSGNLKTADSSEPNGTTPSATWREREKERNTAGKDEPTAATAAPGTPMGSGALGGGPGWGKGGRWRLAAEQRERELKESGGGGDDAPSTGDGQAQGGGARPQLAPIVPEDGMTAAPMESTVVNAPQTPQKERDIQVKDVATPVGGQSPSGKDAKDVQWFYTDPAGLQQGPFSASNMQEWYSHSYFVDDLPLRREHETTYQSLRALKEQTGNDKEPFLSRPKITPPPNLTRPAQPEPTVPEPERPRLDQPGSLRDILESLPKGGSAAAQPGLDGIYGQMSPAVHALAPRPIDHFASNHGSAVSSPVAQHATPARSVWDHAPAQMAPRPAVSPSPWGMDPGHVASPGLHQLAYQPIQNGPRSIFDMPPQPSPLANRMVPGGPFSPHQLPGSPWGQPQPGPFPFPPQQQPGFPPHPMYGPGPGQMPPQPFNQMPMHPMPGWPAQMGSPSPASTLPVQQFLAPGQQMSPAPQRQQPVDSITSQLSPAVEQVDKLSSPQPERPAVTQQPSVPAPSAPVQPVESKKEQSKAAPASSTVPESTSTASPTPAAEADSTTASTIASETVKAAVAVSSAATSVVKSAATKVKEMVTPAKSKTVSAGIKEGKKEAAAQAAAASSNAPVEVAPLDSPSSGSGSKAAPWAAKEEERQRVNSGPSLREIQETEAKQAGAKKAEAKAKASAAATAAAAANPSTPLVDDAPQNMSWGTPARGGTPVSSAPAAPAWGSAESAPKKTLKQIQEEEQRRAAAVAQAKAASGATAAPTKRGYADLAAATSGTSSTGDAWSTVGAGGKVSAPAVTATKPKPMISSIVGGSAAKPTAAPVKPTVKAVNLDDIPPSIEFIRWNKEALKGLNVNVDEFIQMLLSFPVEPAAGTKSDVLEIISDSVYANSSTLDGRRFAQDFYTKRKADALNRIAANSNPKAQSSKIVNSLADIVKTQPKTANNDFGGFKVVRPKGKGRK